MKQELKALLNKIGWDIKGRYPNEYITDHENKKTNYRVMGDRIEPYDPKSTFAFYFKGCEVYELAGPDGKVDCVGIKAKGNDDVFIQFYNHSTP